MALLPPRRDIQIPFGTARVAAWLYPSPVASSTKPGPAIVCGHGLGAVKEMGLDKYCELFQKEGYTAVAFDYRGFGESTGSEAQVLDWNMQQDDWAVVLEYVRSLPEVDASRVGIFGTSFGGGHVIAVAAKDKRVAAAISQCPFTSGPHSAATLGWYAPLALTWLGIKDVLFGKPGDFVPVKLAGKPGEVALMNAPDVEAGYRRLIPPSLEARGLALTVAARAALQIPFLRPGSYAPQVECPIYFAICKQDTVAPAGPTRGWAKLAPKGVVKEYDLGHFSIYVDDGFEQASKDYVDFLRRVLPVRQ